MRLGLYDSERRFERNKQFL